MEQKISVLIDEKNILVQQLEVISNQKSDVKKTLADAQQEIQNLINRKTEIEQTLAVKTNDLLDLSNKLSKITSNLEKSTFLPFQSFASSSSSLTPREIEPLPQEANSLESDKEEKPRPSL